MSSEQETREERVIGQAIRRLCPFIFLCYVVAYLDRVNIGFAARACSGRFLPCSWADPRWPRHRHHQRDRQPPRSSGPSLVGWLRKGSDSYMSGLLALAGGLFLQALLVALLRLP
jgi:hypothetical protein